MHPRDFKIFAITALAIGAAIATSPPPVAVEGSLFEEIEIPPGEAVVLNLLVTVKYRDEAFGTVDVRLDVNGVSDPVTLAASVDGGEREDVTAGDGSDMEILGLPFEVTPCPAFTECTHEASVALRISREEAPPEATLRTASLAVFAALSPYENADEVEVRLLP